MSDQMMRRRPKPDSVDEFLSQASAEQTTTTVVAETAKQRTTKKLKAFNLPVDLIKKIETEAADKTAGNASALAVRIFRAYFKNQENIDNCR